MDYSSFPFLNVSYPGTGFGRIRKWLFAGVLYIRSVPINTRPGGASLFLQVPPAAFADAHLLFREREANELH